jgi:hypothetical protein
MKNLILLIAIAVIFSLSSCKKESVSSMAPPASQVTPPQTAQITKTEQMKVASDFNWKTFKDVQLTLTGTSNSIVEVASANSTVYQRAYLSKDLAYTMKLSVPSYETSVHLLYMGKDVNINLSSNTIDYKFN